MAKAGYINVRIEKSLKTKAEKVLKKVSVSHSQAITMLYRQIVLQNGLPFDVCIPNAETIAAMREADAGGGEVFHGTTEELFEKILIEDDDSNTLPRS